MDRTQLARTQPRCSWRSGRQRVCCGDAAGRRASCGPNLALFSSQQDEIRSVLGPVQGASLALVRKRLQETRVKDEAAARAQIAQLEKASALIHLERRSYAAAIFYYSGAPG